MRIFDFDDDLEDVAVYVISVAAQLAGMHPQTLRQYDRLGLVSPSRTSGRGRRYSRRDIANLREIQRLSQEEGINLAGIARIMELQRRLNEAQTENRKLKHALQLVAQRENRVFAAGPDGEVLQVERGQRGQRGRHASDRKVPVAALSYSRPLLALGFMRDSQR